jgi:carbonic anhydrase/acetyltransferase-like protein (isoleucine patch superfamily)
MIRPLGGKYPSLGDDVFVAPSAEVIGDVVLGARASVWFGCVVRGDVNDIRIGEETNLQDLTVVHVAAGTWPTHVGPRVTVGHRAVVHGCTVGELCLIGIGAIVMDGAVIGDESLVAAGSLVSPGTTIPPRSLALGSPAKVKRALTDAELKFLRESAANYVGYASLYQGIR